MAATASPGGFSVVSSTLPPRASHDLEGFDGFSTQNSTFAMENSNLTGYPRILTAMQLLESSDDESTWCGPPSEPGDEDSEKRSMEAWGIGLVEADDKREKRPRNTNRRDGGGVVAAAVAAAKASAASAAGAPGPPTDRPPREQKRRDRREPGPRTRDPNEERRRREPGEQPERKAVPLIEPRGEIDGDNQKFICVFQIGLDDDEEFCLVKRILGKAGNNMRRIAEECSAKVRLRGIGSGFLEGADGREANMPLQLNLSCTDFDSYQGAVDRIGTLLKDLYKHYRRYARSKGYEPPDVKVCVEEQRRDDTGLDLLAQKAQRSPSQRERDRRAREKERQDLREQTKEKERVRAEKTGEPCRPPLPRARSRDRYPSRNNAEDDDTASMCTEASMMTLPGGAPIPTTAAGRRLAAREGGAEVAAIISAAARQQEREDRDQSRRERDDQRDQEKYDRTAKKREAADRAAAVLNRTGRGKASSERSAPSQYTSSSAKDMPDASWGSWKATTQEKEPEYDNSWKSWDKEPREDPKKQAGKKDTWENWDPSEDPEKEARKTDTWDKNWDPWASAAAENVSKNDSSSSKGKGTRALLASAPPPPPKSSPDGAKGKSKGKRERGGKRR